ncbi:MAG TPA: M20 family metallopeptidase [Chloroflexia bacterium]|nr:M20 family metallopeptidase [Chloroflexia bacterium]
MFDIAELARQSEARRQELINMRRDFHRHPELAFKESRTAGIVADKLRQAGLEVQTGVAETGVVGMLRGAKPGRTVLVRADIDALPILEQHDSEYVSQNQGVMHACGHDGHTAIALTVAELLAGQRGDLAGNVKFVFQPAEEIVSGAKPMIEQGVMQGVDAAIGLHLGNDQPVGSVCMKAGPSMANVDNVILTVRGKGGHGSQPEKAIDSIMAACQLVTTLQTLVSREISPADTAVLSFGTINGGFASNIIAPEVVLAGTVRSFQPDVRETMLRRIEEIAVTLGKALRCDVKMEVSYSCPAVVNDAGMAELVRQSAVAALGGQNVTEMKPIMGSDDMSLFLREVPGCYFVVGSGHLNGSSFPHHHPGFDIEEESLVVGTRVMTQAVLDFLSRP